MQPVAAQTSRSLRVGDDRLASVAVSVAPVTPDTRCAVVYGFGATRT
jgi:hypothetical protein